jgi:ribonuclease HI
MELMAVIAGLRGIKTPATVELTSDSQYVLKGLSEWMPNWKKRGWKTASKQPVKNSDLWKTLDDLAAMHEIRFHWIRGHAGHAENDRADSLAVQARERLVRGPSTP